jgi:hypothetical protein
MIFKPNTKCVLYENLGFNTFGEPKFSSPKEIGISIVRLITADMKTSVRTDSSATRGNAEEETSPKAKFLFSRKIRPNKGDKVEIHGITLRIISVEPRIDVLGTLDHYESDLEAWN